MNIKNTNLILIAGITLIIAIVAIAGCTGSTTNAPAGTAATSAPEQITTIRLGIIPGSDQAEAIITKYGPLKKYLEEQTGYKWEIFVGTDYTSVITAMKSKKIDVASFGPLSYAMANEAAGAEAFAQGMNKAGDLYYHSTIQATPEVAQALGITTPLKGQDGMDSLKAKLDAHKGKYSVAYVDPASTSGYGVCRGTMAVSGLDPAVYFKKTGFLGGHPAVGLAVQEKTVELGVMSDSTLNQMHASGQLRNDSTVTIWVSEPIPNSPMAYRKDLPQDVKDKIAKAYVNCPTEICLNATGSYSFRPVDDSVYLPIHDLSIALDKMTS